MHPQPQVLVVAVRAKGENYCMHFSQAVKLYFVIAWTIITLTKKVFLKVHSVCEGVHSCVSVLNVNLADVISFMPGARTI